MAIRQRNKRSVSEDVVSQTNTLSSDVEPRPEPVYSRALRYGMIPFLAAYTTILILLVVSPVAQRYLTYLNLISLNPIFPPKDPTRYQLDARPVRINRLNAWHIQPPKSRTTNFSESLSTPHQRVFIYHHGNAGTRAWPRRVSAVKILADSFDAHVLSFDYSGFGDNPGTPSEEKLYSDSESVYHWVRDNTNDADIWLYGQSLGTFAAVELGTRLCSEPRPRGLLLEAPPASLIDAALTHPAAMAFRVFPRMRDVLEAILWEKLDSVGKVGSVCLPILIMHGDKDDMIPLEQGERLYHAAKEGGVDVEFVQVKGHGHKNVNYAEGYSETVLRFLRKHSTHESLAKQAQTT